MTEQQIFQVIVNNTREILFELEQHQFKPEDSLKELGANSIDRSEILMMTLEDLELEMSLVDLATAKNIGEIAIIMLSKL